MITRRNFIKITAASGAFASLGQLSDAHSAIQKVVPNEAYAYEGKKQIPIMTKVDIVIVGGSSAAVSAAVSAAQYGKSVFLIAPLSYLGDDICGSFLYHLYDGERPLTALGHKIYSIKKTPTPLYVKTVLEDELIDNQIGFLYSSYVTEVLINQNKELSGVVIANRSGRQAVCCKVLIDATSTATVAQMADVRFTPFEAGNKEFYYTVVGNTLKDAPEIRHAEILPYQIPIKERILPVIRYTFVLPLKTNTYEEIQSVEHIIRDKTWDADQGDSSDLLEYLPFCSILSENGFHKDFTSVRDIPKTAFRPNGVNYIWILSPSADVSKDVAEHLMRPIYAMALGSMIGEWAAENVSERNDVGSVFVKTYSQHAYDYGEIGELLTPLRTHLQKGVAVSEKGGLPILGSYDVIVMGGGTAGAPAGISSARHGAKTLVLEYLHGLGGLTTLGLIGRYWDGFRGGFSANIDEGERNMAPLDHPRQHKDWIGAHNSDWKQEWYRRELRKAGADIWFGVIGCGALVEKNSLKGIVIATPFGRGVVLSKVIIDSTGSADIAIAAGASFEYSGKSVAVQGAGLSQMEPWDYYNNNDWTFIDDSDILDVSRVYVQAKRKQIGNYDIVKLPQTRERRRVVGEYTISVYDIMNQRRYSDTISYHKSSFDTHGMVIDPYFILCPPEKRHKIYDADVPLRSLLPKGLDGIIVTGLGASADRDAMPVIRMQPCLQNQGFAVGYLAAECIKENCSIRKVNIRKIQKYLVDIGNLPERVLHDKDFNKYSNREMSKASESVHNNYQGLEILLTDPIRCESLVDENMRKKDLSSGTKVIYASILCMLGQDRYASLLSEEIQGKKVWDEGWHYTGMGQFGTCVSRMDTLIMALGQAKNHNFLPVIIEKARLLRPEDYLSHFRAVAEAMAAIKSPMAIDTLVELLKMPGIRYHAIDSYFDARKKTIPGNEDVFTRNYELKELFLASALYCCGDKDGIGEKILLQYAKGLQGHYARYAQMALSKKISL